MRISKNRVDRASIKIGSWIFLVFVTLAAFSFGQAQPEIQLVRSGSITVDGKINESEWKDASMFELIGGGKVYLMYDGEHLLVAVRGVKSGWSHLYLYQDGKSEVAVLHASAALGMTQYRKGEDDLWQPSNPFSWDLRDSEITPETMKKMTGYLFKNFWVANNNNMGNPTEIEFKVKPQNPSDKTLYVAIVYAADAKDPQYFPASLKDDTLKEDLIYGNTPADLKFSPSQWAKITLTKPKPTK